MNPEPGPDPQAQLAALQEQHRQAIAEAFGVPAHLQGGRRDLAPFSIAQLADQAPHGIGGAGLSQIPWASFFAEMRKLFAPLVDVALRDRQP